MELLAALDKDSFDSVLTGFGAVKGDVSRSGLVKQLGGALVSEDEASTLLDALVGAWNVGQRSELPLDQAARFVSASELLDLSDGEREILEQRLRQLFESATLGLFGHAFLLFAEDERAYCTSRILSDLRPMFGKNDDDLAPSAALIRHTLKVDVHVDGKLESIEISVNDRALRQLSGNIDRALLKAEALRKIAHDADLQVVDIQGTH